jgi:hypothetical protein
MGALTHWQRGARFAGSIALGMLAASQFALWRVGAVKVGPMVETIGRGIDFTAADGTPVPGREDAAAVVVLMIDAARPMIGAHTSAVIALDTVSRASGAAAVLLLGFGLAPRRWFTGVPRSTPRPQARP